MKLIAAFLFFAGIASAQHTYSVLATFTQPPVSCQHFQCQSPISIAFTYQSSSITVGASQMLVLPPQRLTIIWNIACTIPNSSPAMYYCADTNLNGLFSVSASGASGIANLVFYWTAFGVSQSIQSSIGQAAYTSPGNYSGVGGTLTVTQVN